MARRLTVAVGVCRPWDAFKAGNEVSLQTSAGNSSREKDERKGKSTYLEVQEVGNNCGFMGQGCKIQNNTRQWRSKKLETSNVYQEPRWKPEERSKNIKSICSLEVLFFQEKSKYVFVVFSFPRFSYDAYSCFPRFLSLLKPGKDPKKSLSDMIEEYLELTHTDSYFYSYFLLRFSALVVWASLSVYIVSILYLF